MPAVTSGKVLVTGANGYVGVWTLKAFLDAGFSVRGAVRSHSKVDHLKKVLAEYGDKVEFAIVPDITKAGAFDDAVVGVDAVVHAASPIGITAEDPDEHIIPAVEGTLGVLRSASASASVKRVVFVSSGVTMFDFFTTEPREYYDTDWNERDVEEVETKGRAAAAASKYRASKTIAERRTWEFYEQERARAKAEGKEDAPWDLVVINPPWLFGPSLNEVRDGPEDLNVSNKYCYHAIVKGEFEPLDSLWMDGRDVALALVQAVARAEASGLRLILAEGQFRWEDFLLVARHLSGGKTAPLKGEYDSSAPYLIQADLTKAKEVLGITYRSKEDTTKDILREYEERGWF